MKTTPKTSAALFVVAVVLAGTQVMVRAQAVNTHGPPEVDRHPLFLDSFLPAGMQVIAHVTELMKYEVHPPKSTTTQAPTTPSHGPGVFAPAKPPHLTSSPYFRDTNTYIKLGEHPSAPQNSLHFNRYRLPHGPDANGRFAYGWTLATTEDFRTKFAQKTTSSADDDLDLLGKIPNDLYKLVNTVEDYDAAYIDEDVQVQRFAEKYDDSDVKAFLRQKRIPPTRAYVTLLSLYDNLNKESKTLGLNKYSGYTKDVLRQLADTSTGTSADQLHLVLEKIVERRDITAPDILKKINALIADLNKSDSYLNDALRYIPPLIFDL